MRLLLTVLLALLPALTHAENGGRSIPLLPDAEILAFVEDLAAPLQKAAKLEDAGIRFFLVADETINAFVTGGNRLFIHSGLLLKAKSADEISGVLAHELGHIKAHHIFAIGHRADTLTLPAILSGIAGIGAAAAGAPQAGTALIVGGQAAAMSNLLRFSRSQERAADDIGFRLMEETGTPLAGMVAFMERLRASEVLYSHRLPPYLLTHPISRERVQTARARAEKSSAAPTEENAQLARVQAKLFALTHNAGEILRRYPPHRDDLPALYAQSIALAYQGKSGEALELGGKILATTENDPFAHEHMARLYMDANNAALAVPHFEKALKLRPNATLIRLQYGDALRALGMFSKAVPELRRVALELGNWPPVWHGLALALGGAGEVAESHLALAEEARLRGNLKDARLHTGLAEKALPDPAPEKLSRWLSDLRSQLDELEK